MGQISMNEIRHILSRLKDLPYCKEQEHILKEVKAIEKSIEKDFFRVVVLGEFKRGKSTFINALLGQRILPTDVLPETATITNILYASEPRLQVVYKNKQVKEKPLNAVEMERFSARADKAYTDTIDYVKVGYPLDLLAPKICLVDTPGVADLDESRTDITYGYVPTANAVIFLLDANTPLTKTEKDFIESHILPQGLSDILFIVNKYDHVDEEEDEDFLDDLKRRIRQAFSMSKVDKVNNVDSANSADSIDKVEYEDNGNRIELVDRRERVTNVAHVDNVDSETGILKEFTVLPASSLMALEGYEQGNQALIEESGIPRILEELKSMLGTSSLELKKQAYYQRAVARLLEQIVHSIERDIALSRSSITSLEATQAKLHALMNHHSELEKKIFAYITQSTQIFRSMVSKSLEKFKEELSELIIDMVNDYEGEDFKKFIEVKLPRVLKKQIEQWIVSYMPQFKVLFKQLEQELVAGLTHHFNQTVQLSKAAVKDISYNKPVVQLEAADLSNTKMWAAGLAAIGGMGLISVLGSTVMPLLGAVVIPFVVKYQLKDALKQAKEQALPHLKEHMEQVFVQLEMDIHEYILAQCKDIGLRTEASYLALLTQLKQKVDALLALKAEEMHSIEQEVLALEGDKKLVASYIEVIK
ncbi:MAG: dynamin family protein [Veillonella caviae]|nr:dynamin family protein [Veillonella caviae]